MNNDKNKEINKEQRNKKKNWFKHKLFAPYLLCFLLLFISIFCCSCTNKGEIENIGLKPNLQSSKNISDKGQWVVSKDEMKNPRNIATANLLPDGNVLIMGGIGSSDTAEVFNPNDMKIIKTIPLDDNRAFEYNSITLNNGDVFILGGYEYNPNLKNYPKLTNTTKIFDSKNYTFKDSKPIKYSSERLRTYILNNGHVLILNNPLNALSIGELNQRKYMKFEVYNPLKDDYYETKNGIHKVTIGSKHIILKNGDILFSCYGAFPNSNDKKWDSMCLYKYKENKFEPYEVIPTEQIFNQLDKENYLSVRPELTYSTGYTYNIRTKEKTYVRNRINRTWRAGDKILSILLKNGNVLILGINRTDSSDRNRNNSLTSKYSAYIYDRSKNEFYEIDMPPYPFRDAGIIMLKNGDILFAGGRSDKYGKKIQIYKYRH